jgi:putative holliday junction resolvase
MAQVMQQYSSVELATDSTNMRIMGLDIGDKTIGVAVSDAMLLTAQPRPTIRRSNLQSDLAELQKIIVDNEVHKIVVGQPLHMDGRPSPQSRKVEQFARKLQDSTQLPVVFCDERLTSFTAEQHLEEMGLNWRQRRQQVDKLAAMIILQTYLDERHP